MQVARLTTTGDALSPAIAADANSIHRVGDRVFFHNWVWTPGSPPQQLTQNASDMSASPDGRTIVFVRDSSLWKAESDGTRPTGQQSPWIISIDGGEPRQLVNVSAAAPGMDISADGRSIVFGGRLEQQTQVSMIVCDLPRLRPPPDDSQRDVAADAVDARRPDLHLHRAGHPNQPLDDPGRGRSRRLN